MRLLLLLLLCCCCCYLFCSSLFTVGNCLSLAFVCLPALSLLSTNLFIRCLNISKDTFFCVIYLSSAMAETETQQGSQQGRTLLWSLYEFKSHLVLSEFFFFDSFAESLLTLSTVSGPLKCRYLL